MHKMSVHIRETIKLGEREKKITTNSDNWTQGKMFIVPKHSISDSDELNV